MRVRNILNLYKIMGRKQKKIQNAREGETTNSYA